MAYANGGSERGLCARRVKPPNFKEHPMKIIVFGGAGMIGSAIAQALRGRGHQVLTAGRRNCDIAVDFRYDQSPQVFDAIVRGADIVVNAAGILIERGDNTFSAVHLQAPSALFAACAAQRVARVVHVSAAGLSAAVAGQAPYHRPARPAAPRQRRGSATGSARPSSRSGPHLRTPQSPAPQHSAGRPRGVALQNPAATLPQRSRQRPSPVVAPALVAHEARRTGSSVAATKRLQHRHHAHAAKRRSARE